MAPIIARFRTGQHGAPSDKSSKTSNIRNRRRASSPTANAPRVLQMTQKSIEMLYRWIRDRVARNQFIVAWRSGEHNLANIFTMALFVKDHQTFLPLPFNLS